MKAIFLNFASNNSGPDAQACFACVSEEKTVAFAPLDHRLSDDQLLPALEDVLKKAGWDYKDLTHIACIIGPGGFTSLRMAVSLANVLADQLQIPVTGIHLSDLYAARMATLKEKVWFHSSKKTALFVRTFGISDSPWSEALFVTLEELAARSSILAAASWSGELIPEHQDMLVSLHLKPASLLPITEMLPSFLSSQTYDKQLLQPWYGRGW